MPEPTLLEVQTAIADQLGTALLSEIPDLQIRPMLWWMPTPPCIDIYPADPFQEQERFGPGNDIVYLAIRARVNTPDNEGAQELLLSLMDPRGDASLQLALLSDQTVGGKVSSVTLSEGPTNYGIFPDIGGQGAFLGCTWTARVVL